MRGYQLQDRVHQQVMKCQSHLAELDTRRSHACAQQVSSEARVVEMLGLSGRASASRCADLHSDIVGLLRERGEQERHLREVIAGIEVRIPELLAERDASRGYAEEARQQQAALLDDDAAYGSLKEGRARVEAELANARKLLAEFAASHVQGCEAHRRDWRFRYLLGRRYDTSEYDGCGLLRRIDDWIAARCKYRVGRAWEKTSLGEHSRIQGLLEEVSALLVQLHGEMAAREQAAASRSNLPFSESQLRVRQLELNDAERRFADAQVELAEYGDGVDHYCRRAHALAASCIDQSAPGVARSDASAGVDFADGPGSAELAALTAELEAHRLRHRNLTALRADVLLQYERARDLERDLLQRGTFDTADHRYSDVDFDMLLPAYMGGVLDRADLVRAVVPAAVAVDGPIRA